MVAAVTNNNISNIDTDNHVDTPSGTENNSSSRQRSTSQSRMTPSTPRKISIRSPSFRSTRPRRSHSLSLYLERNHSSSEVVFEDDESVEERSKGSLVLEALTYGIVNSILTIPALYGYAAIIFKDDSYKDNLAPLAKLVLFSSVVHQIVFSLKSSLPFAIGQVQDAGLIFLSSMATAIAANCKNPANILPTTLVTLSISTSLLGILVYFVGKFRLATLVSYLPMPVVGGYLAFIGYFCLQAGLGLTIGHDISTFRDWAKLVSVEHLEMAIPALIGGAALALVEKRAESWLALPACIIALPIFFYVGLLLSGTSLEEARQRGWMNEIASEDSEPFWHVWYMYDFGQIEWDQVPKQFVTWISMTFVVSFSSCLDVVAIEMDMGKELDINHELKTVGLSNILSGVTGGYTGSYIFSQTIFTYRTKTNSRLVGLVVIISEFVLFMAPLNIMSYVPKYFFAATLIFIAFDLCTEWLVHVYHKVSLKEYLVLLGTFVVITVTGDLILGIFVGCCFALINFVICYASVAHVEEGGNKVSNTLREFESRKILSKYARREIALIRLHGFLFFGSSVQIVQQAKDLVNGPNQINHSSIVEGTNGIFHRIQRMFSTRASPNGEYTPLLNGNGSHSSYTALNASASASDIESSDSGAKYLILDFSRVTGMDATAIATGLMRVKQLAVTNPGLKMIFTALRPEFAELLRANRVITDDMDDLVRIQVFDELNDGLGYAENKIIRSRSDDKEYLLPEFPDIPYAFQGNELSKVVASIRTMPDAKSALQGIFLNFFGSDMDKLDELCDYFGLLRIEKGRILFDIGDEANMFYIVMAGSLASIVPKTGGTAKQLYSQPCQYRNSDELRQRCTVIQKAVYGSIVGELHFVLNEPRAVAAIATRETALFFITRNSWKLLCKEKPRLALDLAKSVNKYLSLTLIGMLGDY